MIFQELEISFVLLKTRIPPREVYTFATFNHCYCKTTLRKERSLTGILNALLTVSPNLPRRLFDNPDPPPYTPAQEYPNTKEKPLFNMEH